MTEISELLHNINSNPSCVANIDWVRETSFYTKLDSSRIGDIIANIEDAQVVELVIEFKFRKFLTCLF